METSSRFTIRRAVGAAARLLRSGAGANQPWPLRELLLRLQPAINCPQADEQGQKAGVYGEIDDGLDHRPARCADPTGNTIDAGSEPANTIGVAPSGGASSLSCVIWPHRKVCRPLNWRKI
jgi:hypothetical protein